MPPQLTLLLHEHLAAAASRRSRPRYVDVSTGMRLRYLEWGSGTDVVLLLHDIAEAAEIWAPISARLGERGYRAIAIDLRGEGAAWGISPKLK